MYIKAWDLICIISDIGNSSCSGGSRIYRNGRDGASSDNEGTSGVGIFVDCNLLAAGITDQHEEENVSVRLSKRCGVSGRIQCAVCSWFVFLHRCQEDIFDPHCNLVIGEYICGHGLGICEFE